MTNVFITTFDGFDTTVCKVLRKILQPYKADPLLYRMRGLEKQSYHQKHSMISRQ